MRFQMNHNKVVAVIVLTSFAACGLALALEEVHLTLEQVPNVVRETMLREAAGAEITEIERETNKNGVITYEAEFMRNDQQVEIEIAADGTLLEVEIEQPRRPRLTIDDIPAAARSALVTAAAGANFTEVERERAHGVLIYEAEWTASGRTHEAAVTEDGAVLETEETIPFVEAPAAVQTVITQQFGPDVHVVIEKKMIVLYELEAKINGRETELLVYPTGKIHPAGAGDDDEDDDDGDDDDGDDDDEDDDDED